MNFKGTVKINAPREKVWDFLTDPQQIAAYKAILCSS